MLPAEYRLNSANYRAVSQASDPTGVKARKRFTERTQQQRKKAIARWYRRGGHYFQRWVAKHYRTHEGMPLHWDEPWFVQFVILFGNPWVVRLLAKKAAQMGFTEVLVSMIAFALAELRIPAGFCVDTKNKFEDVISPRVQPSLDAIELVNRLRLESLQDRGRKDIDSKQRNISIGGVPVTFCYAKVSSKTGSQERQVSTSLSSYTACLVEADEVENYPKNALPILEERMSASQLQTKPMRFGSTPGGEGGVVDIELKASVLEFDWWVTCPACGYEQFLHPFGNLARPVVIEENGLKEERYIDLLGAPYRWFHTAPDDAPIKERIETAYLGCRCCEEPIPWTAVTEGTYADTRLCDADGKDMVKGVELLEFHDRLLKEQKPFPENVTINMPRLASKLFNVPERMRRWVLGRNKVDALQQGLGLVCSVGGGRLNRQRLLAAVGRPLPLWVLGRKPIIVMGLDQGQAANIVVIQKFWLGDGEDGKEQWEGAAKETIWYGYVGGGFSAAWDLAVRFNVDLIGIDMDPEAQDATAFARAHPPGGSGCQVFAMDQVVLSHGEPYQSSTRNIQGVKVEVFSIDRTYGLDAVRDRIHMGLHRMPPDLTLDESDEGNFLYQFQTLERLISEKRWTKAKPDHYMCADNFAEMALLIDLCRPKPKPLIYGSISR